MMLEAIAITVVLLGLGLWVTIVRIEAITRELNQHRHALRLLQEALNYRTQQLAEAIEAGNLSQSPDGTDDGIGAKRRRSI